MLLKKHFIAAIMVTASAFAATSASAQAAPGEQIFRQRCMACHVVSPDGKPGPIGPNLRGVVGRKAASSAFKMYSPALQASKITWSKQGLDTFLTAPGKMVPGTRMVIAVPDAKQRADLVAWLATQK